MSKIRVVKVGINKLNEADIISTKRNNNQQREYASREILQKKTKVNTNNPNYSNPLSPNL